MIWIQKDKVEGYAVYVVLKSGVDSRQRMMRINELDKTAYHVFLEYLKQMSFSSHLPFHYYFPSYSPMPEVRIMITKYKDLSYQVSLNLGMIRLSDMDQYEFDFLIGELEGLTSSEAPIGSKVYFQPIKEITNDN